MTTEDKADAIDKARLLTELILNNPPTSRSDMQISVVSSQTAQAIALIDIAESLRTIARALSKGQ